MDRSWSNQRKHLNLHAPFGRIQYSNYSTDKTTMSKTFADDLLLHNLSKMQNPLQKNLADTIVTADETKPKETPPSFIESNTPPEPRSDYYSSFTGIGSFFSGVFNVISNRMFQKRAKSPAMQYYDCYERVEDSPPRDWQPARKEDLNKSPSREQSPAGYGAMSGDCRAAAAHCEDKLNRVRHLLTSKPTSPTTPKYRRRPRRAFVEPGAVEEVFEDAFSPEDFSRLSNESYVECFSLYSHHEGELTEIDGPKVKTELCMVVDSKPVTTQMKPDVEKPIETSATIVESPEMTADTTSPITESAVDTKKEIIASCEDKVNKLKAMLQSRKCRFKPKSADSADPMPEKPDERPANRTKCVKIEKPQNKHYKNPSRGTDKRKKSQILLNIQDDMSFGHEIDTEDVSSPDNSPLVRPNKLCDIINICPAVNQVNESKAAESDPEYFDEVSGRFRSTSTTESEDSFQIVFSDSPKVNRRRRVSDCDSEDSFIVFEESPDSCYTNHDVFGDSELSDNESDSDSEVSDSGCGVSSRISNSLSTTVGNLTDDSLFDDTVQPESDSEDEVDSAVRTVCEEIPTGELGTPVEEEPVKDTGLLLTEAKKLLKRQQPPKKVQFSEKPPKVHVMRVWAFAARAARAGHWERHALDRDRFKRRIADVDMAVSWVLKPQHRKRVMFQRFMPWWNAQRRAEIAERKKEAERVKEEKRIEEEMRIKEEMSIKEEVSVGDESEETGKIKSSLEATECKADVTMKGSKEDLNSTFEKLSITKKDSDKQSDTAKAVNNTEVMDTELNNIESVIKNKFPDAPDVKMLSKCDFYEKAKQILSNSVAQENPVQVPTKVIDTYFT